MTTIYEILQDGLPVPMNLLRSYLAGHAGQIDALEDTVADHTAALATVDDIDDLLAAADAAAASAGTYPASAATTVPGGIASGDYYFALTPDGLYIQLYQNSGGSPAIVTGVRIPTAQYFEADSIVTGTNATMSGANDWVASIGSPTVSVNGTVPGEMNITFPSAANGNVILADALTVGVRYYVALDITYQTGTQGEVMIGNFTSDLDDEGIFLVTPTLTKTRYYGTIVATDTFLSVGSLAQPLWGVSIDNVVVAPMNAAVAEIEDRVTTLETTGTPPRVFAADAFMRSLSRYDKPLIKIGIVGDSLMANDIGGAIDGGLDEGAGQRPIRLGVNSIARRVYDRICWNKAEHRTLSDAGWTLSGTWTSFNDTTTYEPTHTTSGYHKSIVSGAYAEITVPDGMENFAVICHRDAGFGKLNVTLNGGSIASYGPTQIDLARARLNGSDIGNPYHTVVYDGLPAGANVIRIAKEANTTEVRLWGLFYWTGTTLVVHNVAHGGHSMDYLIAQGHMQAEVTENDFDAILFELPIMNECGKGSSLASAQAALESILDDYIPGKDAMFMTCNPFGEGVSLPGGITNEYPEYLNPSMQDFALHLTRYLHSRGVPYIDVFDFFRMKIENRGGTLMGGEGGTWYTDDGEHPNADGCREWFNIIRDALDNKPISAA